MLLQQCRYSARGDVKVMVRKTSFFDLTIL
jgi:hypothetical protein